MIRLGIIGAGDWARRRYLPAIAASGAFELAAVCSRGAERLARWEDLAPGARRERDYRVLLADPSLDAVAIAVPIPLLGAVVADALRSGKHVLSEKPIAATSGEAAALLRLPLRARQVWLVAENYRYQPKFAWASARIAEGAIGVPAAGIVLHCSPPGGKAPADTAWRIELPAAGGLLLDGGIHVIAAVGALLGSIAETQGARTWRLGPGAGDPDTAEARFVHVTGARSAVLLSYADVAPARTEFTVLGSEGSLSIWNATPRYGEDTVVLARRGVPEERSVLPYAPGVDEEFADFAHAIETGADVAGSPGAALADLRAMEAMQGLPTER